MAQASMGILNVEGSGIQICDAAPSTPTERFTWVDLVQLNFQSKEQYEVRGMYLMNSRTLGPVMTMSGATTRPIWMQTPAIDAGGFGGFQNAASPVRVVSQMPDCVPGATQIGVADLAARYLVITRSGLGMQVDP